MRSIISGTSTVMAVLGCLRVMPWQWSGFARPQTKDVQMHRTTSGLCTPMVVVDCLRATRLLSGGLAKRRRRALNERRVLSTSCCECNT